MTSYEDDLDRELVRLRHALVVVSAERDDLADDLDRTRSLCQHLEAALDDALGELAEVRDALAAFRRRERVRLVPGRTIVGGDG